MAHWNYLCELHVQAEPQSQVPKAARVPVHEQDLIAFLVRMFGFLSSGPGF